ncbi:MAG: hypothetical protein AAF982_08660, partial [Pseudomonadota bacterium]
SGEPPNRHDIPYAPGDRLWVREAWQALYEFDHLKPSDISAGSDVLYNADRPDTPWDSRKRPSIFMPRWASRLTLTVTNVRVQRVREIGEEDAMAEGMFYERGGGQNRIVEGWYNGVKGRSFARSHPSQSFRDLWNSLNAKRGFGWDANPWVVAITFKTHRCNIDQMGKTL